MAVVESHSDKQADRACNVVVKVRDVVRRSNKLPMNIIGSLVVPLPVISKMPKQNRPKSGPLIKSNVVVSVNPPIVQTGPPEGRVQSAVLPERMFPF